MQMLNALFVTNRRIPVRRAGPGLCWIFTSRPMYLIKMLGLCVIRLQFVVADRPGRRDSTMMSNLAEVFLSQPKECGAVKFRVSTNEIIGVRMEFPAFVVAPRLFGVVFPFEVYRARAPILLLTRNVIATLEEQDLLARRCEAVSKRTTACARADYDYVVV